MCHNVARHLRKMKAAGEAFEPMIAASTIAATQADALQKTTPPDQRSDHLPPKPE